MPMLGKHVARLDSSVATRLLGYSKYDKLQVCRLSEINLVFQKLI